MLSLLQVFFKLKAMKTWEQENMIIILNIDMQIWVKFETSKKTVLILFILFHILMMMLDGLKLSINIIMEIEMISKELM